MKNRTSHYARHLIALILTLAGFLSWGTLPISSSNQAAQAQSIASVTRLNSQSAPRPTTNGRIAFASSQNDSDGIYTMNPDGSDRKRLTFEAVTEPAWSPNGSKVAFVKRSGTWPNMGGEIFVSNADGSNQTRVTTSRNDSFPAWSPDGTKIAFSQDLYFNSRIYVMNADGSDLKVLSSTFNFSFHQPAWSPDGSRLAVTDMGRLFFMNTDGSNLTQVTATEFSGVLGTEDFNPTWSPDGAQIAFERLWCDLGNDLCNGSRQIWVMKVDGSSPQKLIDDGSALNPTWSPDGTKILFENYGDLYVMNADGSGLANITNTPYIYESHPSWLALPSNPSAIDNAQFFVRQHYRDFLSREPDPDGLAFWTNELMSCGGDEQCIEAKRVNVSAAYFLSIEFQQTGYLVYRLYKAAYGDLPGAPVPIRLNEFLLDTKQIGQSVVVNQSGWDQVLENNKQAFASEFVQRSRFVSAFPSTMTAAEFVDKLNDNAGHPLAQAERDHLVSDLALSAKTRAQVLRAVADNDQLAQQEFNKAFVLMQYFGYLRRDPDAGPDADFAGYNFWLTKLNQFNGNYIDAEMVKAFLVSSEYRQRFAQ